MAWNCLKKTNKQVYDSSFKNDSYNVQEVAATSVRRNARREKPRAKPIKPSVYLNKNLFFFRKKKKIFYYFNNRFNCHRHIFIISWSYLTISFNNINWLSKK